MYQQKVPVVVRVLAACCALALVLVAMVVAEGRDVARPAIAVVGEQEKVLLTAPDGRTVEAIARVDTGASSSSIDTDLAEDLGLDLDEAERVTVESSLGRERRPVVNLVLQVAGKSLVTRVNVNNRSSRSNPVLLGRSDLDGFRVAVGQQMMTEPGAPRSPTALEALQTRSPVLGPTVLLALLPLAALLVVVLRVVVGLSTLGTFAPVLLALGFTQAGVVVGLMLTVGLFALGFLAQPLLRRARLPRVARLGVLVCLVAASLLAVQGLGEGPAGGVPVDAVAGQAASWAALPVVVTATIVERLWETWDLEGARASVTEAGLTLAVALLVTAVLLSPPARDVAGGAPLPLAGTCLVLIWLVGRYRGLRLTELFRFRSADAYDELPAAERGERVPS